ncbi:MAG TPA: ABC transporter substrate-binding protein [bacterium]|nr:ABC transporter substrate-binding protein [bacterium]
MSCSDLRRGPDGNARGVSRRTFLRTAGAGAGLAAAGFLSGVGLTAWTPRAEAAATTGDRGTLLIGGNVMFRTLDPGRTIEVTGMMVEKVTYDTLLTFNGEDLRTPRPHLATAWKVSADAKTFTFTLRQGVRFASGNPLTSADVKWSFDRVLNLKANTLFLFDGVDSVAAPDPHTVVIRTKAPELPLIPILSHPGLGILDSKVLMQNGGDAGADAKNADHAEPYLFQHSAGSGPFMIQSYTAGQELVLVRNPNFWGSPAKLDRVVMRNVPDPVTQALQVVRGDLDLASDIGPDQIPALRRAPNVVVQTSPSATTFYVLMNNAPDVGGPFANVKVQQAVRYALDYDGIMRIAGPGAVRLAGVIPTLLPGSLPSSAATRTDREKAKSLLKESGLSTVSGTFSYSSDAIQFGIPTALIAQKIQSDLAAVGIQLKLDGLPTVTSLTLYRGGKDQFGVWGWAADYADATDFLVYAPGRVVGKRAGWLPSASPEAAKLAAMADAAEAEVDEKKRVAMLQDWERMMAQVGPYAPLFQPAIPYAFRSNVQGVTYNSVWAIDLYTIRKTA